MRISTILDKIDERQLFVPAFQREYVWRRQDAEKLIWSLLREYPTGSMLVWETNKPPELKGQHKYDEKQGAVRILLDGQQRVTTLYMLARGEIPPYYSEKEIEHDVRGLWVDLDTLELSYSPPKQRSCAWQSLTEVLKGKVQAWALFDELMGEGRALTDDDRKRIALNISAVERILQADFPEQTVPIRASTREAIEIFYTVNKSGITLTDAELALAQISGYWPQARDIFKRKLEALANEGFVLTLDMVVYFLLACAHSSGSELHRLHDEAGVDTIRKVWTRLEKVTLDQMATLLRSHAYVDHTRELNSLFVLVPIVAYLHGRPEIGLSQNEIGKLVRWFYLAQLRQRYITAVQTKLDRDLKIIARSENPFPELLGHIAEDRPLTVAPEELEFATVQHPMFTMMRWTFKHRGAVCLTTGAHIHKVMGPQYAFERDHIFPTAILKKHGYGPEHASRYRWAQEIGNRAILTKLANRVKSDSEPAAFLRQASERFPGALEKQCIPSNPGLWAVELYQEFLSERRNMLAVAINDHLKSLDTDETVSDQQASIEDLILSGESGELEFKQTLRWDVDNGVEDKKLEQIIVKTVAAFANSDGGTLLIGVHDDRYAVGLERDYGLLGGRDGFELRLTDLLQKSFGPAFKANRVKVTFPQAEGLEICRVDILRSPELMPVEVIAKDGAKTRRIYVRSGNSSQEMPAHQIQAYITGR